MEKLFYSIGEVAEKLGVNASKLRFWEKEFKELSPKRNDKGIRFYTVEDISVVKQIMVMVENQNLTLKGARRKLSQKKDRIIKQQELIERLKKIRIELKGLSEALK